MQSLTAVLNELSLGQASDNVSALERYATLIREENERASLVSRGDLEAIERRHFAESLALLEALEARGLLASPAIDIGSGAGFPGLPIKVLRPGLRLTLLEANQKKAAFLQRVADELGLTDVDVIAQRAEDAGRDRSHRGTYKLALARAVAPLRVLYEYTLPFLAPGGVLAVPKGSAAKRELREGQAALTALGGELIEAAALPVGSRGPTPTLILVRKTGDTPDRYPRRAGIPRKRPL
jgi:16S rRNA (guanine527-N7)-methyltransferase